MKRSLAALAVMGMLAGPAYSQISKGGGGEKSPLQLQYEKDERDRKENERAYEEQMKRLRSQAPAPATRDPWAGVRPASEPNTRR
jgi:hypothetical protein